MTIQSHSSVIKETLTVVLTNSTLFSKGTIWIQEAPISDRNNWAAPLIAGGTIFALVFVVLSGVG